MKRFGIAALLFAGLLLGCITMHPLGMSDSEWNALTPQQQMDAYDKQAELDREKDRAEQGQKAVEAMKIVERYRHARYGDIITVTISGGTMKIHGKRREYEPIAFDLVKGESKEIEIVRKGKKHTKDTAVVRLSEDGRTFYFDDDERKRLVLVDENWGARGGQTYKIEDHKNHNTHPQNVEIVIRYRPMGGGIQRIELVPDRGTRGRSIRR